MMGPSRLLIDALAVGSAIAIGGVALVMLVITSPRRARHTSTTASPTWSSPTPGRQSTGSGALVSEAPAPAWSRAQSPVTARGERESVIEKAAVGHFPVVDQGRSQWRFSDIAGLDHAVEELREIADFLSDAERFDALGALLPRGILLYGPPGCGKTLLARALAGETGVPFFSVSATSFVEQYVGLGAARVRQLFEDAKRPERSIIFIDELDAIGRSRSDSAGGGAEFDHTLNQLLVELDGFDDSSGVLILAATNRAELLDPALLRAGRFDRRISVEPPDRQGRERILRLHARNRPFSERVDWARVAAQTVGLSPAELANIINEAALLAGRSRRDIIGQADLDEASARQLCGSAGAHFMDEKTRWRVAVHESGHALLCELLRPITAPPYLSILSRGDGLGRSLWSSTETGVVLTKPDLTAQMVLLVAGRAAELEIFGEPSTKAADDLDHAAGMARQMVQRWAMTGRFDLAGTVSGQRAPQFEGSAGGEEVRQLVAEAEVQARALLTNHRPALLRLATALAEQETLSAEEVSRISEGIDGSAPIFRPDGPADRALPGRPRVEVSTAG